MITKFRKLQDTWFAKSILILTGLSFVSLFGVAGYMGSVGKNRPVIKVDSYELLQSEAYAQLDKGKKNILRSLKLGIASILIKRANGIINIRSELKKGTKYEILLPVEKGADE